MSCENDETHKIDNYCSSCATCLDCVEEGDNSIQDQLKGLKGELQKAINERNAAWFQLEENNIEISRADECECEVLGSECPTCEVEN